MSRRVVFDTGVVISALLFARGRLAWLRQHWRESDCVPLISHATAAELTRVLAYPKFCLHPEQRHELLAEYLPYCDAVTATRAYKVVCRDAKDQPFLDLAHSGKAEFLVSGDADLLTLADQARFSIITAADYLSMVQGG